MRYKDEEGQAIVIVALAMSIFLLGAIGLGVDGSHLYSQRQMAQTAADSAAQAGMMSVFDGTNAAGTVGFTATPGTSITCTTTDTKAPCVYARQNGFGGSAGDTVTIDFPSPPATYAPGVTFSGSYATVLVRATVQRNVKTTLMGLLGSTATTVKATAMAAIVDVIAPVPILVTHPTKSGSLHTNGGVLVTICGGPRRSIEVNSSSSTAVTTAGSGTIDLSHAGPLDTAGTCTTGTGADFGVWGGPGSAPFTFNTGSLPGKYIPSASWMQDPLANVAAPPIPTTTTGTQTQVASGTAPCPSSAGPHGCKVLTPGLYAGGVNLTNTTALFKPGIYYIQGGGFTCRANCNASMLAGTADPSPPTGTGTGWDGTSSGGGILVYNTGSTATPTNAGRFDLGANGSVSLVGSPSGSAYKGILFFQDRASNAQTHSLGGGGNLTLQGTIYLTNTRSTMLTTSTQFQELDLQGNPGSATHIDGEIIVGVLGLGGNAGITMNLNSNAALIVSEVAMVQ